MRFVHGTVHGTVPGLVEGLQAWTPLHYTNTMTRSSDKSKTNIYSGKTKRPDNAVMQVVCRVGEHQHH